MHDWLFWVSAIAAGIFVGNAAVRLTFEVHCGKWRIRTIPLGIVRTK